MFENNNESIEELYRFVVEDIRSTLDLSEVNKKIISLVSQFLKTDFCQIFNYDTTNKQFISPNSEYLSKTSKKILKRILFEKDFSELAKKLEENEYNLLNNDNFPIEIQKDDPILQSDFIGEKNLNKTFLIPFFYENNLLAVLIFGYVENLYQDFDEKIKIFAKILKQMSVAIFHASLYESLKNKINVETLLRTISATLRSTLDLNIIKNTIVTVVGKAMQADICFITNYDAENDMFYIDEHSEYRSSETNKSYVGVDSNNPKFAWFVDKFKQRLEVNFFDVNEFIKENNLYGTVEEAYLKEFEIKSAYCISIYYTEVFLGYIIFDYTEDFRELTDNEIDFLRTIAIQAGTALQQANLYKKIKLQAEREKINRNIIEILRSSIDKTVIKKLFVKSIGKFFNANRVYFSDYSETERRYLPVDKDSEYLSDENQKSVINFDWVQNGLKDYIAPLLEKREIKIENFEKYLNNASQLIENFRQLYIELSLKSSYSFPVLYQDRIIGYFCLEFTEKNVKLTEEDIGRIRNICAQAGIAIHHAELYKEAQQCTIAKSSCVNEIVKKIESPTKEIYDKSNLLYNNEFERNVQLQYLANIIESCHALLELTQHQ